jgi:uncharacterized protein YbcV (DUF1398 family)
MNEQQAATARASLAAAYDATMDFPAIVGALIAEGFEGYAVDFRRETCTYYLPSGDSIQLPLPPNDETVAPEFRGDAIKAAIREAQMLAEGYTYRGFCRKVKTAGCAGYIVSFSGRRVLYFGRTAETHVEHFPNP